MSFADLPHPDAKNIQKNQKKPILDKQFDHVMCFGTFDIFHPGHEFYLRESQKFAHKMTVVIARDHRVFSWKWRDPIHNEIIRLQNVQKKFQNENVILGHESDIFAPIREYHPDLLAFGYDQRVPEEKIKELFPDVSLIRIWGYETDKWKSSILRDELIEKNHTK